MLSRTVITTNKKAYLIFVIACVLFVVLLSIVFSVVGSFIRIDNTRVQSEVQLLTTDLKSQVSLPERLEESRQQKNLQLYTPVQHPETENLGKRNPFISLPSDTPPVSVQTEDEDSTIQQQVENSVIEIFISPQDNEEPTAPITAVQDTIDQRGATQEQGAI
ncbi:MAG: hypothetical protein F4X82_01375 [Candidatus Spechtbacteria bacterium SB0662_bin_43]|uniref:Uncharacterized protein n=1 Tax=Candidatus Spechtbacteria bacterium SB0662_bin_43 TaxID=2604897 RepID=A0A845DIY6_9BACT|nr:hypothetical protein [Candidatus Spechtbacteria bacterium SB0662_bin_43]